MGALKGGPPCACIVAETLGHSKGPAVRQADRQRGSQSGTQGMARSDGHGRLEFTSTCRAGGRRYVHSWGAQAVEQQARVQAVEGRQTGTVKTLMLRRSINNYWLFRPIY
jgi:hypothetical protein